MPAELKPREAGAAALREQRYRPAADDNERAAILSALEATGGALAQSAELLEWVGRRCGES